jgi:hypothetical protein
MAVRVDPLGHWPPRLPESASTSPECLSAFARMPPCGRSAGGDACRSFSYESTERSGSDWRRFFFHHRVECRISSLHFGFERGPAGRRCCRNPRAQLVALFPPLLTSVYVSPAMACTHEHAPRRNCISPMFPSAAHKCTRDLPIPSEGRYRYLPLLFTLSATFGEHRMVAGACPSRLEGDTRTARMSREPHQLREVRRTEWRKLLIAARLWAGRASSRRTQTTAGPLSSTLRTTKSSSFVMTTAPTLAA